MRSKDELLERLLKDPVGFSKTDFMELMDPKTDLTFPDLRKVTIRLYDLNENSLLEQSNANAGVMGYLNKKSTIRRRKRYDKLIKRGYRFKKDAKVILAEGDSWFQFPVFLKDIIDWLAKRDDYVINSIAYGGDWLTNILYEGKYIEELSIHQPDVFLISGSGNDMVGGNRLAIMVDKRAGIGHMKDQESFQKAGLAIGDPDMELGRKYITKEFYAFVLIMKAQYWKMFEGIRHSGKLRDMQIITQGYANAIPSYSRSWSWRYPLKPMVNWFVGTGKWLKHPMMIKGIPDSIDGHTQIHRKIIKTMIHELNEMFIELSNNFTNVHHIDSRNLINKDDHWFDELHLQSHMFEKVAATFEKCIDSYKPVTVGIVRAASKSNSRVYIVQ